MQLEFTWHGCDSALAAPLVLGLARLAAAAQAAGHAGPLTDLAFFFEDPLGAAGGSLAERVNKPWRTGPLNEFLNRSPAYTLPGTGRKRPP